jgi:hypothetical protein
VISYFTSFPSTHASSPAIFTHLHHPMSKKSPKKSLHNEKKVCGWGGGFYFFLIDTFYWKQVTFNEEDILTYAVMGNKTINCWQSTYSHNDLGLLKLQVGHVCSFKKIEKKMLVCSIQMYGAARQYIHHFSRLHAHF